MKSINQTNQNKYPHFNDIEELFSYKWNTNDFYRKGKLISTIEKTDEQTKSIESANNYIQSYLASYGITSDKVMPEHYTFLSELAMFWWAYNPYFHHILLRDGFARLPQIIHETLHYLSTTQLAEEKDTWKIFKSWFESYWNENPEEWYRIFTYLNEWVTEKIARDICTINNIDIWKCMSADDEDKVWVDMMKSIESEAKDIKSNFEWLSDEELFENEDFKAKFKKILLKAMDKAFESEQARHATAYDSNVKIVNIIINCLAITRHIQDDKKSFTEHQSAIRHNILENYFHGWMMRMREIEKVFWKNYLRNLATTPRIWDIGNNSPKYQWSEAVLKMTTKQVLDSLLKIVDKETPTISNDISWKS